MMIWELHAVINILKSHHGTILVLMKRITTLPCFWVLLSPHEVDCRTEFRPRLYQLDFVRSREGSARRSGYTLKDIPVEGVLWGPCPRSCVLRLNEGRTLLVPPPEGRLLPELWSTGSTEPELLEIAESIPEPPFWTCRMSKEESHSVYREHHETQTSPRGSGEDSLPQAGTPWVDILMDTVP